MTTDLETRLRRYATAQDAAIRASLRSTPDSMSTASAIRIDQAVTAPEGRRKFAILGVCTMLVASTIGAIAIRNTSHPEVQGSPDDSTSASPAAGPLPSNVVETALDNSPVPATSDSTPSPTQQPPPLGEGHARVPFTGGNLVLGSDRGWEMFAAGEGSSSRTTSLIDLEGAPTGTPFTNPWIAYRRLGVSPMEDAWLSVASLPRPLRQTDPTASAPTESPPVTAFATIPGPPLQTISIRGTTGTSSEDIWTDLQWEEQGRTVWVSSSLSATELVRELESAVWQDVVGLEQVAGPVADRCYRLENPVVTHDSDLPYFSLPGGTDIEGGKATTVRSADGDAWSRTRTYSSTGADIRTLLITRVDWSKHQCYPSNEGFDGATWANAVAVQVGAAPAEIVEDPATGQFAVRWRVDTGVDALIRSTGLSRDELLTAAGTLSSDPSDGRSLPGDTSAGTEPHRLDGR